MGGGSDEGLGRVWEGGNGFSVAGSVIGEISLRPTIPIGALPYIGRG